jgi:hypothetical protein
MFRNFFVNLHVQREDADRRRKENENYSFDFIAMIRVGLPSTTPTKS